MKKRNYIILAVFAALSGILSASAFVWLFLTIQTVLNAPLPFHFTQPFYEARPSLVCPGDMIEWTAVIEVNSNVSSTTSTSVRTWINIATGETIEATPLGTVTTFVWGNWPGVGDYYREFFGQEVKELQFPYQVARTLSAAVPENAPYDTPIMLVTASLTQVDAAARYGVPLFTLSEEDCLD